MFRSCINRLFTVGKFSSSCFSMKNFNLSLVSKRCNSIFSSIPSEFLSRKLHPISYHAEPWSRGVKRVIDDAAEPHRLYRFDRITGKRTSVKIVGEQFYRLNWGIWIRTKRNRDFRPHKKRSGNLRKTRQHVFCNAQQSRLLDKLTGPGYKRRRHYVDDEYEPYQSREEFLFTRKKPVPPTENYDVKAV